MEPTPPTTTDAPPRRRSKWKWFLLASGAVVAVAAAAMVVVWTSPAASFSIHFIPGVYAPNFAITNSSNGDVTLRLQLECQTNGHWIAWPPRTNDDTPPLAQFDQANWSERLIPHSGRVTQPWFGVDSTTLPLRLRGFVTQPTTGLADLQWRWQMYRWSLKTKTPTFRKMAFDPTQHAYLGETEFFTTPFCMTNAQVELRITMGKQAKVNVVLPSQRSIIVPHHIKPSDTQPAPLRRRKPSDSIGI